MFGSAVKTVIILAAFGTADLALAQNQDWPRFHVGVAVGEFDLTPDLNLSSIGAPPEILDRFGNIVPGDDTGNWKLFIGFRPTRVVGVEIQYVDFGEGGIPPPTGNSVISTHVSTHSSADATVLAALLFIPLRSRPFDVYGKVGVANVDESFGGYAVVFGAPCVPVYCSFSGNTNQTDSHPYFGVGFRHEISRVFAFRAEYDAIDRDGDDTTMFSLGVAWER